MLYSTRRQGLHSRWLRSNTYADTISAKPTVRTILENRRSVPIVILGYSLQLEQATTFTKARKLCSARVNPYLTSVSEVAIASPKTLDTLASCQKEGHVEDEGYALLECQYQKIAFLRIQNDTEKQTLT